MRIGRAGSRGSEKECEMPKGRGFAGMSDRKQRQIASKGGSASGGNFKNDRQRASEAGRKGGQH
jgi:general stress protein YciG